MELNVVILILNDLLTGVGICSVTKGSIDTNVIDLLFVGGEVVIRVPLKLPLKLLLVGVVISLVSPNVK